MSEESQTADVVTLRQTPDAIELRHLRAFIAVAEELNFGRAAGRLYLSQPALSRQIRALERLVGCDLLRRSTHRVELTLAGEALLDRAKVLLADLDAALAATRSVGGELIGRVNRLWAPLIEEILQGTAELGRMRAAYERMLAQAVMPDELTVLPLTAGGVPALQVSGDGETVPGVLHLHGGGLVLGSAYGYRALAGAVADSVGSGVLLPDYRLAPEHPFPAAIDDARNAYLWLLDQGVPPSELIVSGDSGGGGLALSLMVQLRELGIPLPAGVVMLCPGLDFAGLLDGSSPLLDESNGEMLAKVSRWYIGDHPADDPLISPLGADLHGLPPMLIQAGTGDPIAHDARLLAARAEEYGVEVTMELYPVDTHIFQLFWSFLPEARQALAKVGEFAARVRGDGVRRTADA
ncbi:alpha/beta hydrolase fold domain-containing protein [Kribbella monticola]|uniref:alpha/beta hydrolase fold domain-containing protein n=1 Tax=Kribbella monticola TaxID=2185285 RepID=UPI000DD451E0|nr:alpha/beta hydrolase fold domain-containing protein [Kribbella monticola]